VRFGARVLMGTDAPLPSGLRAAPADGDERLVAFMPKLRQLFRYKEYASLERYRAEVAGGHAAIVARAERSHARAPAGVRVGRHGRACACD
jgi:hypothetical protein